MYCSRCEYKLEEVTRSRRCTECGRFYDPTDPTTFISRRRVWLRLIANPVSIVVTIVGALVALHGRSTSFGFPSLNLALALLILSMLGYVPVLVAAQRSISVLDRRLYALRRSMAQAAVVLLAAVLIAEAWTGSQDLLFYFKCRNLPRSAAVVSEQRWWPYRSHSICFDPAARSWSASS